MGNKAPSCLVFTRRCQLTQPQLPMMLWLNWTTPTQICHPTSPVPKEQLIHGTTRWPQAGGPMQHRFSPYEVNGGTVIGVSGKDFAIVASDTRFSRGYSILSRDVPKYTKLTDKCV